MAVPLTSGQRDALRSGPLALYLCVDLFLDGGTQRFWDGPENAVISGDSYLSIGAYAGASVVSQGADLGGNGIELTLDATKLLGAAADVSDPAYFLSTIISAGGYRQRPMRLSFSFWNADTGAHILQLRKFTGVIDQMQIDDKPATGSGEGRALLVIKCESLTLRYGQRTGRVRSHADQQEIWPGDDFFKLCAGSVATERSLNWGHKAAKVNDGSNIASEHARNLVNRVTGRPFG